MFTPVIDSMFLPQLIALFSVTVHCVHREKVVAASSRQCQGRFEMRR